MTQQTAESVEKVLRDELVRGDAVLATARPVLRHLLTSSESGLISDELVARVRGMVLDIAEQLLFAQAAASDAGDQLAYVAVRQDLLARALFDDTEVLSHVHALALEGHLLGELQQRSGIDPVLSPVIEELAARQSSQEAALAMAVLAAQARFQQQVQRMRLPLGELPGEMLHRVLVVLRRQAGDNATAADGAEQRLRTNYQEGTGRLALLARLVMGMGPDSIRALDIERAGLSIFATALSMGSDQARDLVVVSLVDPLGARLALSLRAAGLGAQAAIAQVLHFRPGISLPAGFETLAADSLASLLASSPRQAGG